MSDEIFLRQLRIAMKSARLTQAELGAKAGIAQGAISNYMTGKRYPASQELLRIAKVLGVTMEWLMTGAGPAPVASPAPAGGGGNLKEARAEAARLERLLGEAEASSSRLRLFLG